MIVLRIIVMVCVSILLCVSAYAKLSYGYRDSMDMSMLLYYAITIGEPLLGLGLWTKWGRLAASVGMVSVAAGIGAYWLVGVHGNCGCFGGWHLSRSAHLALLSSMGFGFYLVAHRSRRAAASYP